MRIRSTSRESSKKKMLMVRTQTMTITTQIASFKQINTKQHKYGKYVLVCVYMPKERLHQIFFVHFWLGRRTMPHKAYNTISNMHSFYILILYNGYRFVTHRPFSFCVSSFLCTFSSLLYNVRTRIIHLGLQNATNQSTRLKFHIFDGNNGTLVYVDQKWSNSNNEISIFFG